MRPLPTLALLLLVAGLSAPAAAQTTFRLTQPLLTVDGQRVETVGAPLEQRPFGQLTLVVPQYGTYTVSEEPFAGARRRGQFDGRGLYFSIQGHSIRLLSADPILSFARPVSAYVRYEPDRRRRSGPARVAVVGAPATAPVVAAPRPVVARYAAPPPAPPRPALTATASTLPELSYRPAARYLQEADVARLRADVDRLADAQARPSRRARARAVREATSARPAQVLALEAELDRLAAESRRLSRERDELQDLYEEVVADRDAARRDLAALRSSAAGTDDRVRALAAELRDREDALARIRDERADRGGRLATAEAELGRLRGLLADARAERDAALAQRDAARTERDAARAERDEAVRARDAALARAARLRADVERLEARVARLEAELARLRASGGTDAEHEALLEEFAAAERAQRALEAEAARLPHPGDPATDHGTAMHDDEGPGREAVGSASQRVPRPEPAPVAVARPSGPHLHLPGFDFGRLQNPDEFRRRLDATAVPGEGEVLVLFETDTSGRVVRSAVPAPLGSRLDTLAEDLVRGMRFEPPQLDGEPAPLRSQVLVRFER